MRMSMGEPKRLTTLALLALACLMGVPSIAQAKYRDGMNLYQYVHGTPSTYVDPTGLQKVRGNKYGDWAIMQANTDSVRPGEVYRSVVEIVFQPNKDTVCCDEISFIQAVRHLDMAGHPYAVKKNMSNRISSTGWSVDRVDERKYAWYGYNDDGTASVTITPGSAPSPWKNAVLHDTPYGSRPLKWTFETVAICKKGMDAKRVYGALRWGFDVDTQGLLESHTPTAFDHNSDEFLSALYLWNMQALGAATQRNHPRQALIDIDYWGPILFSGGGVDAEYYVPIGDWAAIGAGYWNTDADKRTDVNWTMLSEKYRTGGLWMLPEHGLGVRN